MNVRGKGTNVNGCSFSFNNLNSALLATSDISRRLKDGTRIECSYSYTRQKGREEEKVLGRNDDLKRRAEKEG
jgi:hypothetical protein